MFKMSLKRLACFVLLMTFVSISAAQSPPPKTEQTSILWSLAPCQSSFWIPSSPNEFSQSWVTYKYEGNPLSQSGECIFTLESDLNTKIELNIDNVHLFNTGENTLTPCLSLYDVHSEGSINLLKKQCSVIGSTDFQTMRTYTDTNLAIITTTIRYGSFELRARTIPKNYSLPSKVNPSSVNMLAIDSTPETRPVAQGPTNRKYVKHIFLDQFLESPDQQFI